jgi:ubiquitin-like-conjugating enzyme ATG10
MSITEEEFKEKALEFLEISGKLNDGWRSCQKDSSIYLVKTQKIQRISQSLKFTENLPSENSGVEDEDPSCSENAIEQFCVLTAEYHLVYSTSYQVPVIYFNFFKYGEYFLLVGEKIILIILNENFRW